MDNDSKINQLVEKGLLLKNEGNFQESTHILKKVLDEFPKYSKINGVNIVIAGNYYNLEMYKETIYYAKKVQEINPKIELVNQLLYLAYFGLGNHEKSFEILFNYLEKNPADLFKSTLEELMDGLLNGYGTSYKDKILYYARKNNVLIPSKLDN